MLDKYGVELIGAKLPSIDRAEDRELFKQSMKRIGLSVSAAAAHRLPQSEQDSAPALPLQLLIQGAVLFAASTCLARTKHGRDLAM
jgi:carbamoylphosphate synthase large subunit